MLIVILINMLKDVAALALVTVLQGLSLSKILIRQIFILPFHFGISDDPLSAGTLYAFQPSIKRLKKKNLEGAVIAMPSKSNKVIKTSRG